MQSRFLLAIPGLLLFALAMFAEDGATQLSIPLYGRHGGQVKQLQSTSTQIVKFARGGLIRVTGSYGDLIIEGSDEPDVQIDVKKWLPYGDSDKSRLDRVAVAAEKRSDSELDVTVTRSRGVGLETHIHVPRNSRLAVRQSGGTVSISNVTADIDAASSRGDIVLWLPEMVRYAVDAKSKFGTVSSDFAGSPRVLFYRVGESFTSNDTQSSTHVRLRVGVGGITIKRLAP